jgi:hypothetical protein
MASRLKISRMMKRRIYRRLLHDTLSVGQVWSSKTTFDSPFVPVDIQTRVYLDGVLVDSSIGFKKTPLVRIHGQRASRWTDGTKWRSSNFAFSELKLGT